MQRSKRTSSLTSYCPVLRVLRGAVPGSCRKHMPKRLEVVARRSVAPDSSSEEDEDQNIVTGERYAVLELDKALLSPIHRIRAAQELSACFKHIYEAHANKGAQAAMLKDALLAVQQVDRRPEWTAAMNELVKAGAYVLPQQKRAQLVAQHKHAMLSMHRGRRKPAMLDASSEGQARETQEERDEGDEEEQLQLLQLPDEVIRQTLLLVDPVSLGRCQCVCRLWRSLTEEPSAWRMAVEKLYGPLRPKHHPRDGNYKARLAMLARSNPAPLLLYKTTRVWVAGQLGWQGPAALGNSTHMMGMSVPQVIAWLKGKAHPRDAGRSISHRSCSSSISSSDSGSDTHSGVSHHCFHTQGRAGAAVLSSGQPYARAMRLWALPGLQGA